MKKILFLLLVSFGTVAQYATVGIVSTNPDTIQAVNKPPTKFYRLYVDNSNNGANPDIYGVTEVGGRVRFTNRTMTKISTLTDFRNNQNGGAYVSNGSILRSNNLGGIWETYLPTFTDAGGTVTGNILVRNFNTTDFYSLAFQNNDGNGIWKLKPTVTSFEFMTGNTDNLKLKLYSDGKLLVSPLAGFSSTASLAVGGNIESLNDSKFGGVNFGKGSGNNNVAIGYNVLGSSSAGYNIALGHSAMRYSAGGGYNLALGRNVLQNSNIGSYNIALGDESMYGSSGSSNISIGASSGYGSSGSNNIFIGNSSGAYVSNSNKLIIHNLVNFLSPELPLVVGDFSTGQFNVNGTIRQNDVELKDIFTSYKQFTNVTITDSTTFTHNLSTNRIAVFFFEQGTKEVNFIDWVASSSSAITVYLPNRDRPSKYKFTGDVYIVKR
jgi:hypothetical protein